MLKKRSPDQHQNKTNKKKRPEYRGIQVANVSSQYKVNVDTCFSAVETS